MWFYSFTDQFLEFELLVFERHFFFGLRLSLVGFGLFLFENARAGPRDKSFASNFGQTFYLGFRWLFFRSTF